MLCMFEKINRFERNVRDCNVINGCTFSETNNGSVIGVSKQFLIEAGYNAPLFFFVCLRSSPEATSPYHLHQWEHVYVNYIISSCGSLVDPDGIGNPVEEGASHSYRSGRNTVTGTQDGRAMTCAVPKEHE